MSKPTLLVLAAGLGSRYNGQKQVDSIGDGQETLMEFALYDAVRAGIEKVVFIINDRFPDQYKTYLTNILKSHNCQVFFVEQTKDKFIPEAFLFKLKNRQKPLGTAHAVYCAKEVIDEPFITINADDFYGEHTFKTSFESVSRGEIKKDQYAMVAFKLKNTLSDNGTVSRGVCDVSGQWLNSVEEHTGIANKNGIIHGVVDETREEVELDFEAPVSMNFWVLDKSYFDFAERDLLEFLQKNEELSKKEFYLPAVVDKAIRRNEVTVKVLDTDEKWFGLTYHDDKKVAVARIKEQKKKGVYPEKLWDQK